MLEVEDLKWEEKARTRSSFSGFKLSAEKILLHVLRKLRELFIFNVSTNLGVVQQRHFRT